MHPKPSKTVFCLLLLFALSGCVGQVVESDPSALLNDVHSRLNPTRVAEVVYPKSTEEVIRVVKRAKAREMAISISGGRHAMGGQQFGRGTLHLHTSKMDDVLSFDRKKGIVRVEAGIQWPKLIEYLLDAQEGEERQWGIVQKQTGADWLSLGGSVSANIHGRGVKFKPIVQDIESFTLVNADGKLLKVSRTENPELFRLAIGGYGLFGVITTVDLRLMPRLKLQRVVEIVTMEELPERARQRLEQGFLYGDFQYKTDEKAGDFMQIGVFSTYKPVSTDTPIPKEQQRLTAEKWHELMRLAHADKAKAFESYANYYLTTSGQVYWSDLHQMSYYMDDYVEYLEKTLPNYPKGSLMITELYVSRNRLQEFIQNVIQDVHTHQMNVIYGTMRLIERDDETFLAWAKQSYACVIFNLRVEHTPEGIEKVKQQFQRLIDRALELDGSFYLTYHRWASKDQILRAYPQFPEFLRLKLKYDPEERFQSEWYRHYKKMFVSEIRGTVP